MGVGLFSQVTWGKMRGNGLTLHQGKNFFTEGAVKLPREVVESPSLKECKSFVDEALWNVV